ncbi:hypothetical protein ACFLS0_03915, partial [Candidatus Bipolaricaulota bacterium]
MSARQSKEEGKSVGREEALALQKKIGVFNALEVTRNYAFTPDHYSILRDAGIVAFVNSLATPQVRRGVTPEKKNFNMMAESIEDWYEACSKLPEPGAIIPVLSADDILEAKT